jgi:hypothetical protein
MQAEYGLDHVRIVCMLIEAGTSRDVARKRQADRLNDPYFREYPLHGRVNAERILQLLN